MYKLASSLQRTMTFRLEPQRIIALSNASADVESNSVCLSRRHLPWLGITEAPNCETFLLTRQ
jgi:hypothetical protein